MPQTLSNLSRHEVIRDVLVDGSSGAREVGDVLGRGQSNGMCSDPFVNCGHLRMCQPSHEWSGLFATRRASEWLYCISRTGRPEHMHVNSAQDVGVEHHRFDRVLQLGSPGQLIEIAPLRSTEKEQDHRNGA